MENNPAFENVKAIQFIGGKFGAIYDCVRDRVGLYTSDFKNEIELNGETVRKNDWVVKNEDGTFSVMSNYEFEEKLEKEK